MALIVHYGVHASPAGRESARGLLKVGRPRSFHMTIRALWKLKKKKRKRTENKTYSELH